MYNFKEKTLGPNFAPEKLKEFKNLINAGLSFVVISLPGVGVSYFLKYLAMQDFARSARGARRACFFHIDLYSLPTLSQHEFYKLLLLELGGKTDLKKDEQLLSEAKTILKTLAQKEDKIVLIFSRFDQLQKEFDWNFLSNIQSLTNVAQSKIVLIFTSTKPLHEIAPEATSGGNLNFYSEQLYFKPYNKEDLKKLCQIEPNRPISKEGLDRLLELSGGHNQLLHILLSSHKQQNLLLDRFVKLQLKEFIDYLVYQQRKQIQKVTLGKKVTSKASHPELVSGSIIDEYLLGVGMVKQVGSQYQLFTPLLTEYIKTNMPAKLPVKEAMLFKLLKQNMGKTVLKDEIFQAVWGAENEDASDWALDALIYRLRKHPFMQSNGYIIESQKKVGYTLIQT